MVSPSCEEDGVLVKVVSLSFLVSSQRSISASNAQGGSF